MTALDLSESAERGLGAAPFNARKSGPNAVTRFSPGFWAAFSAIVVGALCLLLSPWLPWVAIWPDDFTLPVTAWIGAGLTSIFEILRPAARLVSFVLGYPMVWANVLLVNSPYSLTLGLLAALGWYVGGLRMTALVVIGLGFVLLSGYWTAGMNTLALVLVSVPMAIVVGTLIGLLANEVPSIRRPVETTLDVMQTVPTFAYLTPLLLLFGFGPVVGLIASVIYAAPPMARNVLLGLERVEPDIKEAAVMNGANRFQQLFLVEMPSASKQLMVGVNQSIMAGLSMVIIAAVIGGFNDIGWEVLLTMRKAAFGQSLVAGLVIVIFAIVADRISSAFANGSKRHSSRVAVAIAGIAIVLAAVQSRILPGPDDYAAFKGVVGYIDAKLGDFTAANGATLEGAKNWTMYFILLPVRVGLSQSVLPFTWGFQWTEAMSLAVFAVFGALAIALVVARRAVLGLCLLIAAGIVVVGVVNMPWPFVLCGLGALGWISGGPKLSAFAILAVTAILVAGLWGPALLSVYLCTASVLICVIVGGLLGVMSAVSPGVWRVMQPICDFLQTIPQFVFLIPVLMIFQIGEFSAFLAICAYAVVPLIRYTRHGLVSVPEDLLEAAVSSGASEWQVLREVRLSYSAPTILLGLNQTILCAFSMLVIAALIGTTDLGQQIYLALGQGDVGLGVAAGAAMALLALVADRIVQGFAAKQRKALGL